jgi:hypothetical protein
MSQTVQLTSADNAVTDQRSHSAPNQGRVAHDKLELWRQAAGVAGDASGGGPLA